MSLVAATAALKRSSVCVNTWGGEGFWPRAFGNHSWPVTAVFLAAEELMSVVTALGARRTISLHLGTSWILVNCNDQRRVTTGQKGDGGRS
jgi:hypothetical protein